MEPTVTVRCKNNGTTMQVPMGSKLDDIYGMLGLEMALPPVIARVNNKVEGMHFRLYKPKDVEFLDVTSPSGMRTYTRSLFFVLCKAVKDLYERCKVAIDIPVSNGYCRRLSMPGCPSAAMRPPPRRLSACLRSCTPIRR